MVLAAANTKFPLGVNTDAEYTAFRGGSTVLNFAGGVAAAKARYGITIQSPTPYTQAQLKAVLSVPGRAYAVAGKLSNFALGHAIRRWAPSFGGFHAVCVIPLGGGLVLWLDPMAPRGFAGDKVTVADVADVFAFGNYPNDARYLEVAGVGYKTNELPFIGADGKPALASVSFIPGKKVRGWALDGTYEDYTVPAGGSSAPADTTAAILQEPRKAPQGGYNTDGTVGNRPFVHITAGLFADHPYIVHVKSSTFDPGIVINPPPPPTSGGVPPADAQKMAKQAAHDAAADVAVQADVKLVTEYAAETYPAP
jgi:hypothetical protein